METRSKKKKKLNQNQDQITSPAAPSSDDPLRPWSDLPQDLLHNILTLLSCSLPDLLSFSFVCRSWRSISAASFSFICRSWTPLAPFVGPPLLLSPVLSLRRPRRWSSSPRCRLLTLTSPRSYLSKIPSKTLRLPCLAASHGHLVFLSPTGRAVLADAFTGTKIRSPLFPPFDFRSAILTAPPSSLSCTAILVSDSGSIVWKVHANLWAKEEYLRFGQEVRSLAVFNGMAYCLDDHYRLKVVNVDIPASWKTMELQLPEPPRLYGNFGKCLVECDGELLMVRFTRPADYRCKIEVYRLDLQRVQWVEKDDLGDWCLFVDVAGKCPLACRDAWRWGGRSNCVYVAGPGCDSWSMFPLDGSVIDVSGRVSALSFPYKDLRGWPSPIWVYPSNVL